MRRAVAFLTPIPVGAAGPPTVRTPAWFPAVGAVVGLAVGGAWWAAGEAFPPLVAAAVAVGVDLLLTGALHVDGLADAADGLLPHHASADRRRAVMAAPDVGAFGVAAVVAVLLLRWSALASLEPDPLLLAAVWAASRSCMAAALARRPYVGGGLGTALTAGDGPPAWPAVTGIAAAGALAAVAAGAGGIVAVAVAVVAAAGVVALGHRRLGGVTGDVLGAAGVVAETAALVAATA